VLGEARVEHRELNVVGELNALALAGVKGTLTLMSDLKGGLYFSRISFSSLTRSSKSSWAVEPGWPTRLE